MVFDFLQPISASMEAFLVNLPNKTLGKKVIFHTKTDFPVLIRSMCADAEDKESSRPQGGTNGGLYHEQNRNSDAV